EPGMDAAATPAADKRIRESPFSDRDASSSRCGDKAERERGTRDLMHRRVAITGTGVLCPLGRDLNTVWTAAMDGRSAVAPLTLTNPANEETLTIPAAKVPEDLCVTLPKTLTLMTDRFARFAVQAAGDAVLQAGLDFNLENRERCGVATGSCMNGIT